MWTWTYLVVFGQSQVDQQDLLHQHLYGQKWNYREFLNCKIIHIHTIKFPWLTYRASLLLQLKEVCNSTRIWKWRVCAYRRTKTRAFDVGFCRKKGSLGVGFKKIGPFWCKPSKLVGHLVLILSNLSDNSLFSAEKWQNFWNVRESTRKIWNFTLKFWKWGHWVWTLVKNGVIWCRL